MKLVPMGSKLFGTKGDHGAWKTKRFVPTPSEMTMCCMLLDYMCLGEVDWVC